MGTVLFTGRAQRARRRRATRALAPALVLLGVFAASVAQGDSGSLVREGGARRLVLAGAEARGGIELPDDLVVVGTDSVCVDLSPLLRGEDYSIDYGRSTILIERDLADSARVEVSYLYLPLDLKDVYRHAVLESLRALPEGFSEDARLLETADEPAASVPTAGLRIGGAKTFGITVGSERDPTLEQSLRLSMSGRITRDVTVNAYLSDQNTPLVPEGDTEELRALDKVLIEIEGERMSATMGDYELALEGGSLADFRRELSGVTVAAGLGPGDVVLAGARSAGEFMSHTFRGVDGKQGPYLLPDREGSSGVPIVAGSERVWLGGRRLRRGTDNDYVIDYATGQIQFTERRPITSDSEVAVDYEYSISDYERDVYAGRASAAGGRIAAGVSFFREADDRGASSSIVLTEEQIAILEEAGDDVDLAHDDGVYSVGVGNGDYWMIEEGVFEYAGADSGEYVLSFEREDGGDYDYDYEEGHYVYVGPGEGEYGLGRALPLPTDHGLVALDSRVELPFDGFVEIEAAVSSFDENTFSELDDDDNLGNAQVLSAALPALGFGALGGGALGVEFRSRRVAGNFKGIGRFRDVHYEEKWELEGLDLPPTELLVEGSSTLSLGGGGRLALSHAHLSRGKTLESRKTEFSVETRPTEHSRVWADGRFVDLDSTDEESGGRKRTLYGGGAEHTIGFLRPGVTYRHDSRTAQSAGGERYDEYGASLESAATEWLSFGVRYAHRLTDRTEGEGWDRASTTRTQEYLLRLSGSEKLSLQANVTRRVIEFEEGLEERGSRYDLADMRVSHRSLDGGLSGEVRYTVTSTEVEEKEKHVTEEDGVQITRIISTGRFYPVTDLSAGMKWTLKLRSRSGRGLPEPTAWRRFLSSLSLESDLKLNEITTADEKRRLYLLDPSVIRGDDTVRGAFSGRHVARYVAPDGSHSIRLAFLTRDALDQSYTNASERRTERSGTADVKLSRARGTTYGVRVDAGTRDQRAVGAGSSYEIDETSVITEVSTRRFGDLEMKLSATAAREDDTVAGVRADQLRVTPSVTYRFKGRGVAVASLTRTEVTTTVENLPSYMAGGRTPGVTTEWRLSGDYRFNRYLTGSLMYTGEDRPGSGARHTVDIRVNAFF